MTWLTKVLGVGLIISAAGAAASAITVLEPQSGAVVRPGSSVLFRFQVDPTTQVTSVRALKIGGGPDVDILEAPGPGFEGQLTIPANASGQLQFVVFGRKDQAEADIVEGPDLTLNVLPYDSPESLEVTGSLVLSPTGQSSKRISVIGRYVGGIQRDVAGTGLGTTYVSSNSAVATVSPDGVVTAGVPGTAYVTIGNANLIAFTQVRVLDATSRTAPTVEETARASFSRSGIRRDPKSGRYVQTVQVRNISTLPIGNPIMLVLSDLPEGVRLENSRGRTKRIEPLGSYVAGAELQDADFLTPGASKDITLQFSNPEGRALNYTIRLYSGRDL